jgi:putative methionine-R-sulfoxide reductase with GAF domain
MPITASLLLLFLSSLSFFISFGLLILLTWQRPAGSMGGALLRLMASLVFLNASVIGMYLSGLLLGEKSYIAVLLTNLSVDAFALSGLMAFGLIVHAAGQMKDFWQLYSRAGVVAFVLFQWPLWNGDLFTHTGSVVGMLDHYTLAGALAGLINASYLIYGLALTYVWRRRINLPLLVLGVGLLLGGQLFTLVFAPLRQISFPSVMASVVGLIIGFVTVRIQFFDPLIQRAAQLSAIRELTNALSTRRNLQVVLDAVVTRTYQILKPAVVLVFLVDSSDQLVVAAQYGGDDSLRGRVLQRGEGLAGRVLELQNAMDVASYCTWDGQAAAFKDQSFYASLSVPLIDGDDVVGVLNIHEVAPGRIFNAQDKAVAETLAAQAGLCIVHERMRYDLDLLRSRATGIEKRATGTIHFDETGTLIFGDQ